ncbi:MAG: bifunctional oligoribonuclease/PAP phosphatase NrnA [Clostridia bacterium]|nr:bifunctional oligoribonuclease/PAP phosphatase NrnA [Clostridia bacterium]
MTPQEAIYQKILEFDSIIIIRHKRPDGDALGSSFGLREVLRASFPEKRVICQSEDSSLNLSFMGSDDPDVPAEEYRKSLVISLDTATCDRLSNSHWQEAGCLVRIDHHVDIKPYCEISWVEDKRSSTCEMIVAFCDKFSERLKLTPGAAELLYTGMVTDSGRFQTRDVTGDTLRLAARLLDAGIDTETLYANLSLEDFSVLTYRAYALGKIERTENGVAWLYVTDEMQKSFGLGREDASASVSFMERIKGSFIWIAFIDNPDGSIRVRMRSRFIPVNRISEKYRGGGHECACGATLESADEILRLLADADDAAGAFGKEHPEAK